MNYNTIGAKNQAENLPLVLDDYDGSGRRQPWAEKKMQNENLARAYLALDVKKADRLLDCGTYLRYKVFEDGTRKLDRLNSCRVRLCPLCAWRRSLKCFYNTDTVCRALADEKDYRYIMLTLTVKNCTGDDLSSTIDFLFTAWNRFIQITAIKSVVCGWMRTLEVTHNTNKSSPAYDTYHPHFHVLLCVAPSYFKKRYISRDKWAAMWKKAARLDYEPQVDVRVIKRSMKDGVVDALRDDKTAAIAAAAAEVSKYATKPEDYIIPNDWDLTVDAVATLDQALANRRLIAYGGIMREKKKQLQLEDEETGSLINVDQTEDKEGIYRLVEYFWFSGAREYRGREKEIGG